MNNFHEILINQLAKESSFVTDDGELKKFIIIDAAFNMNRKLIELLLEVPEIKQKFFTEISGHWVFDINLFVQYMENKNFLKDSYTRYRNKIGLNIGGKFLNQRNEVSLVWPFKDCILEGGQSREDQKRPEIFFNEILAQQEIDQLTEPKVLTNWKRYTVEGEKPVTELKRKNGIIKENLIIKGNNLLALHSLLPQFEEKVKLIYIDPPYNTGSDSFQYNDSFNHSSWLTFMKNRLEIGKKLLRKDGIIFIQIDENELGYLKPIADDIFGRENFEIQINWQRTTQRSVLGQGATPIINIVEYILVYKKSIGFDGTLNKIQKIIPSNDKMYNQYNLLLKTEGQRELVKTLQHNGSEIKFYRHKNFILESIPAKERTEEKYIELFQMIVRKDSQQQESSLEQIIMGNIENDDTLYSVERILKQGKNKGELKKSFYMNNNVIYYLKEYADVVDNKIFRKVDMNNLWLDYEISSAGISEEGDVKLKRGKKPEGLLKRIIEIGTNDESDIVLDYHLGSGTTAAVAHKMKRQYIGIEQLDYGKNDSTIRLRNVIGKLTKESGEMFEKLQFDQSGISKAVNWQGGGEFVYCELKKYNQSFIEQIEEAETSEQLLSIWEEMKVHSFLNYNVDIKKQDEAIEDFKQLSIETQKQHLCEILNKNQLYVNLSSIDDEDYKVSADDKRLTRDFYEIKDLQEAVQTKADL
jgi:adenine-specific DNA-methyltransferase